MGKRKEYFEVKSTTGERERYQDTNKISNHSHVLTSVTG